VTRANVGRSRRPGGRDAPDALLAFNYSINASLPRISPTAFTSVLRTKNRGVWPRTACQVYRRGFRAETPNSEGGRGLAAARAACSEPYDCQPDPDREAEIPPPRRTRARKRSNVEKRFLIQAIARARQPDGAGDDQRLFVGRDQKRQRVEDCCRDGHPAVRFRAPQRNPTGSSPVSERPPPSPCWTPARARRPSHTRRGVRARCGMAAAKIARAGDRAVDQPDEAGFTTEGGSPALVLEAERC